MFVSWLYGLFCICRLCHCQPDRFVLLLCDNSSYLHWCVCCLHSIRFHIQCSSFRFGSKITLMSPQRHLNYCCWFVLCYASTIGKLNYTRITSLAQIIFNSSLLNTFQTKNQTHRDFAFAHVSHDNGSLSLSSTSANIQICIRIMKAGNASCEQNQALKLFAS